MMLEWKNYWRGIKADGFCCTYEIAFDKDEKGNIIYNPMFKKHLDGVLEHLGEMTTDLEKAKAACETHAAEQLRLHQEWAGVPDYRLLIKDFIDNQSAFFLFTKDDRRFIVIRHDGENLYGVDGYRDSFGINEAIAAAIELVEKKKKEPKQTGVVFKESQERADEFREISEKSFNHGKKIGGSDG
jgi:hypothetical protein